MKHSFIKYFCLSLFLLSWGSSSLFAQERAWSGYMRRHEVALNIDLLGLGSLPYDGSAQWSNRMGSNILLGAGYTYWLGEHFGLSSGLGVGYMMSKNTLSEFETMLHGDVNILKGEDVRPVDAQMSLYADKVTDDHTMGLLRIPLQLSFVAGSFYANAGLALAIPFATHGSFSYDDVSMKVLGFDDIDIDLKRSLDGPVLASITDDYNVSDFNTSLFWMFALDLGVKFHLDARNMISLGFYFNYSLNKGDVQSICEPLVGYSHGVPLAVAPMQSSLVDSYRLFNLGIHLAYNIGVGSAAAKRVSVIY